MGILTFIKAIPTLIKTAKFWVIAIVLASLIGSVIWFVNDYKDTLQELAVAEQQVNDLTEKFERVDTQLEDERERTQKLRNANSQINSQYLATVRELQDMQQNYEMLKQNPTESELKIEASFNNFMKDVSCITGDSTQCPE